MKTSFVTTVLAPSATTESKGGVMKASLIAEYRKFVTTRMWWILALSMAAYLIFTAVVVAGAFIFATDEAFPTGAKDMAISVYSLANSIGYPFAVVIGTLAVTGEFRHQTITGTLLANPSRTTLVISKMIAAIPIGFFYGIFAVMGLILATGPILQFAGDGAFLTDADVIKVLVFSMVALALWTMVGVSFGLLMPNQIAAIIVIIGFTQFLEPIARIVFGFIDSLQGVAKYFPGAAADALVGSSGLFGMGSVTPGVETLTRVEGALVLLAYAVVFAIIGRFTTLRRDIA